MRYPTLRELPAPAKHKTGWPWTEESERLPDTMSDGSPWPKISIVTPSYNQGQFIEETIRSVLLQGYPNLEYIIIDGGSTDNSVEVIKKYSHWLTYWVSEADRGQSHAINKGFSKATGKIYAWLNSDDFLLPGALGNVATAYRDDPSAVAWAGICYWVDPNGRILKTITPRGMERDSIADWWIRGVFGQSSCFFAAWTWMDVNRLDESLHYSMDLDLWVRISTLGRFINLPYALSAAIVHDKAKTQAQKPEAHAETTFVQIKHGYREVATRRLVLLLRQKYRLRTVLKAKLRPIIRRMGLLNALRRIRRKNMEFLADKIKDLTK